MNSPIERNTGNSYLSPASAKNIPIKPSNSINNSNNSSNGVLNPNNSMISNTTTTSSVVKPPKSHKRFGHFKKSSISNLPVSTYHPLTHHGYKGDESFVTEEAANFQIKNVNLLNGIEEPVSNAKTSKSKTSRIPFLSHKRNNSSVSHDSNGTASNVNVLSSSKLEMHPIVNQL